MKSLFFISFLIKEVFVCPTEQKALCFDFIHSFIVCRHCYNSSYIESWTFKISTLLASVPWRWKVYKRTSNEWRKTKRSDVLKYQQWYLKVQMKQITLSLVLIWGSLSVDYPLHTSFLKGRKFRGWPKWSFSREFIFFITI